MYKLIMVVNLLNALMLQLNTIIQLLTLFKLILYSNLLTVINVALYFTFDSYYIPLKKIKKKIVSRPTDPISNHKATGNKHIFLFGLIKRDEMRWGHNVWWALCFADACVLGMNAKFDRNYVEIAIDAFVVQWFLRLSSVWAYCL